MTVWCHTLWRLSPAYSPMGCLSSAIPFFSAVSMRRKFCIPLVDDWYTKPYREAISRFDDLVERTNL